MYGQRLNGYVESEVSNITRPSGVSAIFAEVAIFMTRIAMYS